MFGVAPKEYTCGGVAPDGFDQIATVSECRSRRLQARDLNPFQGPVAGGTETLPSSDLQ